MPEEPSRSPDEPEKKIAPPSPINHESSAVDLSKVFYESPDTSAVDSTAVVTNQEPPKHKKKGLLVGGIIGAVVLVAGVGGWAAYALWYQSPDKVVLDAFANALMAKTGKYTGGFSSTSGSSVFEADFDVKDSKKQGTSGSVQIAVKSGDAPNFKMSIDAMQQMGGDSYLKFTNLKGLYDNFMEESLTSIPTAERKAALKEAYDSVLTPMVNRIESKWLQMASEDIKQISTKFGNEYECTQKILNKLGSQTDRLIEIGDRYSKHKFISVEKNLGTDGGNFRYLLKFDEVVFKDFVGSLKTTKLYKDFGDCSSDNPLDAMITAKPSDKSASSSTIEVWIDQWNHQLTKMRMESTANVEGKQSKSTLTLNAVFNTDLSVTAPTNNVVLFKDAFPELGDFVGNAINSGAYKGSI